MPDRLVTGGTPVGSSPNVPLTRRFRDMGDGTWAEVVYAAGAATRTDLAASSTAAANTPVTATLPAAAGKTTYITGFSVTVGTGTAAPAGLVTVTGTVGGTLNNQLGGSASGTSMDRDFSHPVPASAANTAITVNVPALGATTGAVAVVIRGYQQ